jgi:protein SCO1/2
MKNRLIRFIVLSALGFVLGAGMALWQKKGELQAAVLGSAAVVVSETTSQEVAGVQAGVHVGGPFSLVDQNGKKVTEKSWPGKYKLVFFGFTHCPDTCPATLQKFSVVMKKFDPKGEKIVPLFITVDPARDTVKTLKSYLSSYPLIVGLTGTEKQIDAAEQSYKIYAARTPGQSNEDHAEYMEDHSAYIYLMSPDDKLLQTLPPDDPAEAMIGKIKQSVK